MTPEKAVIGIITPLPIAGQPMNPMMMPRRRAEPWYLYAELKKT